MWSFAQAGFALAGVEIGGCWCGDSLPTRCANLTGSKDVCKTPCPGKHSETCGGQCAVSAYKFRCEAVPPAPPAPAPPPPPPLAPITPPAARGVALASDGGAACTLSVWQLKL